MPGLMDILTALGQGASSAVDSKRQSDKDAATAADRQRIIDQENARQRSFAAMLQSMGGDAPVAGAAPAAVVPTGVTAPVPADDPSVDPTADNDESRASTPTRLAQLASMGPQDDDNAEAGASTAQTLSPDPTTPNVLPTKPPATQAGNPPIGPGTSTPATQGTPGARTAQLGSLGGADSTFDPRNHDYSVEYNGALQKRELSDREASTTEAQLERQTTEKREQARLDQEQQARIDLQKQKDGANRAAYAAAQRVGVPEAKGTYDPTANYQQLYTDYNTARSADRGDANAKDEIGVRRAEVAHMTAETSLEQNRQSTTKAETEARGSLLKQQIGRLPPADQQALQTTYTELTKAHPELSDNQRWGMAGEQYERSLLPGQKVHVRPGNAVTPPAGQVPVTDPALQAEILRNRAAGGTP